MIWEETEIRLHLDATAAQGILERTGIAKIRHIDVNVLWLQEQCARKMVPVKKVPGTQNQADLMTKHLAIGNIVGHMARMDMHFMEGRSGKAAKLHSMARLLDGAGGEISGKKEESAADGCACTARRGPRSLPPGK